MDVSLTEDCFEKHGEQDDPISRMEVNTRSEIFRRQHDIRLSEYRGKKIGNWCQIINVSTNKVSFFLSRWIFRERPPLRFWKWLPPNERSAALTNGCVCLKAVNIQNKKKKTK